MPSGERETQYLYLTTRGRKTGLPREIEIWFTTRNGRYYVIAEYPNSHWVENLRANPQVQVRLGSRKLLAQARVLSAELEPDLYHAVEALSREKYGWGEGLPVELVPEGIG
ncbi:MAG TPA: nitroreductase family deazaflavin-dependent oxidoreductase [Terriglobales bacterium]|nr:nitroreductase family deazaflavin-dependent oxidoreductase [Terriglobales bacterium]